MAKQNFGLIGLAVMGENLALNVERNGFAVSVFNRSTDKVDAFMEAGWASIKAIERSMQAVLSITLQKLADSGQPPEV